MIATILIGGGIALYAGFVICARLKDIKKGKYCSCGCKGCPSSCNKK